jgi:hypothetical protein
MRKTVALRGCEIVMPMPDDDRGEKRGGHRPQADALEGERAEVVPEGEREEDRDLRVLT